MILRAARSGIPLLVAALLPLIHAAAGRAQDPHAYSSTTACKTCHRAPLVFKDFLGESSILGWSDVKHDHAFRLLYRETINQQAIEDDEDPKTPIPERELVTRILGFNLASAFNHTDGKFRALSTDPALKDKVAKVRLCLNCHATETREDTNHVPLIPFSQGVSCQACHGPGGDWHEAHQHPWWRRVSHTAKHDKGFTNVRDPAARAQVCASCHVGNLEQGKFVTHDWYAKGHPPLPSFEYSTFAAAMPVHWRPAAEKKDFKGRTSSEDNLRSDDYPSLKSFRDKFGFKDDEIKANYHEATFDAPVDGPHNRYDDLPRLRDTLISSVAVLDMYAKLMEDYARYRKGELSAAKTPYPSQLAEPEFAVHDCGSCHHELRSGKRYPFRPFGKGLVGRPPAYTWPQALAKVSVWQGARFDTKKAGDNWNYLSALQTNFDRAVTEPIFGDKEKMGPAAVAYRAELANLITRLKDSKFNQTAARETLLFLTNVDEVETRDFHSARQVAWAIREIAKDSRAMPYRPQSMSPADVAAINGLFNTNVFQLDLPAHAQTSIVENNSRLLPGMDRFESETFEARLRELQRLGSSSSPQRPGP